MNTTELAPRTTTSRSRVPWSTELVGAGAAVVCALVLWTTLVPLGGKREVYGFQQKVMGKL